MVYFLYCPIFYGITIPGTLLYNIVHLTPAVAPAATPAAINWTNALKEVVAEPNK